MRRSISMAVFITFFISLSLILSNNSVIAQVTLGKLSAFEGEVELEREGTPIPVELNMPIVAKDRIRVEEGTVEIEYDDGSILKIRPYTDLTLDQIKKKRKILGLWTKTYLSRLISIFAGKVSGIIKKRRDLVTEFETPTIVAGVRGTILDIVVDPETGATDILVDVDVVEIFTRDGWTVMTLAGGDSIGVYVDPDTGAASVHSYTGTISVRAGDTTSRVEPGATMTARVDPETGGASVVASEGTIEVTVGEASATLDEGEAISANVDPETGVATIVATEGDVPVTAQGETQTLTPGTGTTVSPGEAPTAPAPMAPPAEPYVPPAPEAPELEAPVAEEPPVEDTEPASPV